MPPFNRLTFLHLVNQLLEIVSEVVFDHEQEEESEPEHDDDEGEEEEEEEEEVFDVDNDFDLEEYGEEDEDEEEEDDVSLQSNDDGRREDGEPLSSSSLLQRLESEEAQSRGESNGNDSEGVHCPICLESWSSQGRHQVSCLPCGHVYGLSCIERWFEQKKLYAKCPQCNRMFTKNEIIKLYVPHIPVTEGVQQKKHQSLQAENELCKVKGEDQPQATPSSVTGSFLNAPLAADDISVASLVAMLEDILPHLREARELTQRLLEIRLEAQTKLHALHGRLVHYVSAAEVRADADGARANADDGNDFDDTDARANLIVNDT